MPRNGAGTATPPAGNPVVAGTAISTTWGNNTVNDVYSELTNSIPRDGQAAPTANLPMGGYRHTNVADAAVGTQYLSAKQAMNDAANYVTTVGGTVDVITLAPTIPCLGYVAGQRFVFTASGDNTTTVTINVTSLGAKDLKWSDGSVLAAGDIVSGAWVYIRYNGTSFVLESVSKSARAPIVVNTLANLKKVTGATNGQIAFLSGYTFVNDGAWNVYAWNSSSTATANNGSVVQATAIVTGRWLMVNSVERRPQQFGSVGDGVTNDDTAMAAAFSGGNCRVIIDRPHYLTSAITVESNTTVEFLPGGSVVFDGTGSPFRSVGALGSLYLLASNISKGDTSFTVGAGDGVNFAAGNVVWVQSEATALGYPGHKKAELVVIDSVSGDTINIEGCFADSYAIADTAKAGVAAMVENVRYINPMLTNKKWTTAITTATGAFIVGYFVRGMSVEGGLLAQNNSAGVVPVNCMDFKMRGVHCRDLRDNTGMSIYGYGVEIAGATILSVINGCTFERCRHGVTTGTASGGPTPNYGVQRGVSVSGCTAIDCSHTSFDTHEDSDGVTISGNTVIRGAIVGIATRSYRTTITGNTIMGVKGNGIYCDDTSLDTTIAGNTISNCRQTGNTAGSERGHGVYVVASGVNISGNTISYCDNFGVYVGNTGAVGRDVEISGNMIMNNCQNPSTTWASASMSGVYVNTNGNRLTINGNHITDSQVSKTQKYGIWVDYLATDGSYVTVQNNNCMNNGTGPWLNTSGKTLINFIGNIPRTMPGFIARFDTSTGSIPASSEATVSVVFGSSFANSSYDIMQSLVGTNLEIKEVRAVGASGIDVRVYNRDAGSARTGAIRTTIIARE